MVGSGETVFITSESPCSNAFFQHTYFNSPSSDSRNIPQRLPEQLEKVCFGCGDGIASSLLKMMSNTAYYLSLMTNHIANRRCGIYCTDTLSRTLDAVNEALLFSYTDESVKFTLG